MLSTLKALWDRLGGKRHRGGAEEVLAEAVEYKGYRIRPTPYAAEGQYQTAGVIEKDFGAGVKEYRFVRADRYASRDDAGAFAVTKGKQIVDEQGDRIFE